MKKIEFIVTCGDPAGIGIEISLKVMLAIADSNHLNNTSLKENIKNNSLVLTFLGSKELFAFYIKAYDLPISIKEENNQTFFYSLNNKSIKFPLISIPLDLTTFKIGEISAIAGQHSLNILEKALLLTKEKSLNGIITCPINKQSVLLTSQKNFIGHTEFFANAFKVKQVSMTFMSSVFNLVLMTTHLPLKEVSKSITKATIIKSIENAIYLQKITKDKQPIMVLGLNPHAGEGGNFGKEEEKIAEIIQFYRSKGTFIIGPISADTAFLKVKSKEVNTVIACYHDQGLIPLKLMTMNTCVNVTLGLPIIRTSVDHGTAFDITGKNKASHQSLLLAITKAFELNQWKFNDYKTQTKKIKISCVNNNTK